MEKHLIRSYCLLAIGLIIGHYLVAQTETHTADKVIDTYFVSADSYAAIYSGKEQAKYPLYFQNHPYYKTDEYQEGSLSFDGAFYPHVKLRLDLHLEEIIIQTLDTRYNIIVPNDRVDYVYLGTELVTRNIPHNENNALPAGYYIRLYDGQFPVWLRQTCPINEKIEDKEIIYSFRPSKRFYIYINGKYHRVSSKGSVLKLFPSHKKELKKYIKSSRLNFKQSPENAIVEVVKQYERLNTL